MATSNCSNGLNGVESPSGTVCCSDMCDVCGGSGCGGINGTTAHDCCLTEIFASEQYCGDDVEAPCILVNGTNTAAPTMTALPSNSPTPTDGESICLEDRRTLYNVIPNDFINLNMLQLILESLRDYCRHSPLSPAQVSSCMLWFK